LYSLGPVNGAVLEGGANTLIT